jgi:antitoxin MazE
MPRFANRTAVLRVGCAVEISPHKSGLLVKTEGDARLSLAQMLEAFDPKLHGGEAMATAPVGKEKL